MQVRYFRKRFQTNAAGIRVNQAGGILKDPYWYAVGLLLRSRTGAANGGQNNTVLDGSANNFTITRTGNVTQGTFSPYGSVGGSLYFDGTGDYLTAPNNAAFAFGTGDFTVEGWFYLTNSGAVTKGIITGIDNNLDNWMGVSVSITTTNLLQVDCYNTANQPIWNGSHQTVVTPNAWHHFAMVRTSGNGKMFLDGVLGTYVPTLLDNLGQSGVTIGHSYPGTNPWFGYLSDIRVVKGSALYTANFTVPTAPLTAVANTQLLLSGTNSSLCDASGRTGVETAGNAQASTTVTKFGSTSMYFDGSGDKLELTANPGQWSMAGQDFTVEFWVYPTSIAAIYCILSSSSYTGFEVQSNTSGNWILNSSSNGTTWDIANGIVIGTVALNTWQHLAVCRSGGKIRLFKDGVLNNTVSSTAALIANTTGLALWSRVGVTPNTVPGYMDEVRITKGVARYTSDFAVDTQVPLDPYAKQATSLVTNGVNNANGNTVLDGSVNNFTITRTGNVAQGTFSPFSPSSWSWYVDGGVNSAVYAAANAAYDVAGSDFTIEGWVCLDFNFAGANQELQIINQQTYNSSSPWYISVTSTGALQYSLVGPTYQGTGLLAATTFGQAVRGRWFHFALVRQGSTISAYQDGVRGHTFTTATALFANSGTGIQFGRVNNGTNTTNSIKGFLSNFRIVKGNAVYNPTLTTLLVPTAPLTAVSGTGLLMAQANRFKENSGNNIACSVTASSANSVQAFSPFLASYDPAVHGGSLYFDGTGDYVTVPKTTAVNTTGDFTVEAWVYIPTAVQCSIVGDWTGTNSTLGLSVLNTGRLYIALRTAIPSSLALSGTTATVQFGAWNHIAACRSGTTTRLFVNGVVDATTNVYSGALNNGTAAWYVGVDGTVASFANCYIADLRIIKDTALYTASFTPPTAPLTAVAGTQLLLNGTNAAAYDTTGRVNLEMLGTCKLSTAVKKYSASIALDGTSGCYAKVQGSPLQCVFGTGDFTIEFWAYFTTTNANQFLFDFRGSGDTTAPKPILYTKAGALMDFHIQSGVLFSTTIPFVANAWTHFAISRVNGTTRLFQDGVLNGSATDANNYVSGVSRPTLGSSGNAPNTNLMTGYIEDFRITKGVGRYATGFQVPATTLGAVVKSLPNLSGGAYDPTTVEPTGGDPYYNQVVLHMHMNGSNGGTNFADQKGHNVGGTGASISNNLSRFGWTSLRQSAIAHSIYPYLYTDGVLGTGDFTIEMWFYTTALGSVALYDGRNAVNGLYPYLVTDTNNKMCWYVNAAYVIVGTTTTALNVWTHVAVSRYAGKTKLFVNGVQEGATWTDNTNYICGNSVTIGNTYATNAALIGYIDEVRVTKGVARYTGNFTVPTAAFPDYQDFTSDPYLSQSVILKSNQAVVPQLTTWLDSSVNNFAITKTGDAIQTTMSPYASGGGSTYFDGSGDWLTISGCGSSLTFGTGNFTVEGWFYPTSTATQQCLFLIYGNTLDDVDLYFNGTTRVLTAGLRCTNQSFVSVSTGASINMNAWNHFAYVRDGATTVRLFLNGAMFTMTIAATATLTEAQAQFFSQPRIGAKSNNDGAYFQGYLSDYRFVKGTAVYTSAFTPPTSALTAVAGTSALLGMQGASTNLATYQNNTILDGSANKFQITRAGNVTQGTFSPFSNGGSLYFDGTGDSLYTAASGQPTLNGDFTVECWVYDSSANVSPTFVCLGTGGIGVRLAVYQSNMDFYAGGTEMLTGTPIKNQWVHYAMTRSGTTVRCFQNGVQFATTTKSGAVGSATTRTIIGSTDTVGGWGMTGHLADVRVIDGTALYTSTFTPPTAPLTAVTNTQLLLSGTNAAIIDSTGKAVVETVGTAKVDRVNKRYSGGLSFDGTSGCYAVLASNQTQFTFGTGDFTIEMWINRSILADQTLIDFRPLTTNGAYPLLKAGATTAYYVVSGATQITGTTTIAAGVWYHVAISRVNGVTKLFVNGVQEGSSYTDANNYLCGAGRPVLACDAYNALGTVTRYSGLIEDLRITKGVGRYQSNFTVPLAALPAV